MVKRTYSHAEKDGFAEERRVQLERLQAQIAEKVVELTNGQEWQRWLRVASRFHQYSFGNSLAVFIQRPDATLLSGYRMWQTAFNRQVNKGEKGIRILAPITRLVDVTGSGGAPILDADGRPVKALRPIGFKVISVFDVSQTSGEPLPEQPRPVLLTGQAPDGLWDSLQGFVEDRGFRVERGACGGANGVTMFTDRIVRVRADVDDAQAVRTLAHEAGHVLLHDPSHRQGREFSCRGVGEVEAESVAFLVTHAHGLDSAQYTFRYVAGWAEDALTSAPVGQTLADVITATGSRVVGAADTILVATDVPAPGDVMMAGSAETVTRSVAAGRARQTERFESELRRSPRRPVEPVSPVRAHAFAGPAR